MGKTDNFRRQHKEILSVAKTISDNLDEKKLAQDSGYVRSLLSDLTGKVKVHLKMEDDGIYPILIDSNNDEVKTTAQQFSDEMGGLSQAYVDFVEKWPTPLSIQQKPAEFISEITGIFNALSARIEKEDNILYEIFDKV